MLHSFFHECKASRNTNLRRGVNPDYGTMLPTNLTTNEVKNAAGTEVEFLRQRVNERQVVFQQSAEQYDQPHRLDVSHAETGSGTARIRRSKVGVAKTVTGSDGTPVTILAYTVVQIPVGNLAATTEVKNVVSELMSFLATTGAATTVLFDCTGYGADSLVNGTL